MPGKTAPLILLADDHTLIREGVRRVLRKKIPGAKFQEAGTSAEVVRAVQREKFDLVVLDLGLPGSGEFETLTKLKAEQPQLRVLVFSSLLEDTAGLAALRAGADGFLSKTADSASIASAVVATLAGRGYFSERLKRASTARAVGREPNAVVLSPRELEVLTELVSGQGQKQIAARLGIGVPSVATYRLRLMNKLAVKTTAELLRYAVEHRLARR